MEYFRWGPFFVTKRRSLKYIPLIGRFLTDESFFGATKEYPPDAAFGPRHMVMVFESTALYLLLGFVAQAFLRTEAVAFASLSFAGIGSVEYALTRSKMPDYLGWSPLRGMSPRAASHTFVLLTYHAFFFLLLGVLIAVLLGL